MTKKLYLFTAILISMSFVNTIYAQTAPSKVSKAVYFDISAPLRTFKSGAIQTVKLRHEVKDGFSESRAGDIYTGIGDKDAVRQRTMGTVIPNRGTGVVFSGQSTNSYPSDCNGAAGRNGQFMQTINSTYQIFDKSGTALTNPTAMNTLFEGVTGANNNDGDPLIIYDENADRWVAVEFSISDKPFNYMLIAVSTTNDATGSWYRYSFEMYNQNGYIPDYEKIGIWRDGYYMGTNTYALSDIYVFQRELMLTGNPNAQMLEWDNPYRPAGLHVVQPIDNDGPFAPVGTPAMFMDLAKSSSTTNNKIRIYECTVDWVTTNNSTFIKTQDFVVAQCNTTSLGNQSIHQLGTTQTVDALSQVLMYRVQYRNFGDHQTIVAAHTVDVDATSGTQAGIRWYELRKASTSTTWAIRQQSTYAPDALERWIPSIAMNANHEIALGYSVSSSTMYPGIRYCGQSEAANTAGNGVMDIAETVIFDGTQSQPTTGFGGDNRWGDYSQMSIDPEDDFTFWFTTEYYNNGKRTKIASLQLSAPNFPQNLAANAISGTEINVTYTANGSNPTLVAWSSTPIFGTPTNGRIYNPGEVISGGGTILTYGTANSFLHQNLTPNTQYFYKVWSNNNSATVYSTGVLADATTFCSAITATPWSAPINDFQFSNCFAQEYVIGAVNWITATGNGAGVPATAHSGQYNALLKTSTPGEHRSLLIMPTYDFSTKTGATLTFWYAQNRQFSFQDELRVMYKTTFSDTWTEAAAFTTEVQNWTQVSVPLPFAAGKADYYVGFEGNAKGGKGIVLDDISIAESTSVSVNKLEATGAKLYPNPSKNGIFNLKTAPDFLNSKVIVTDIVGKEIFRQVISNETQKIDLSNQAKGIYLLKLKNGQKVYTSHLVIK